MSLDQKEQRGAQSRRAMCGMCTCMFNHTAQTVYFHWPSPSLPLVAIPCLCGQPVRSAIGGQSHGRYWGSFRCIKSGVDEVPKFRSDMVLAVGKPRSAKSATSVQPSESDGPLSLLVRIPLLFCR